VSVGDLDRNPGANAPALPRSDMCGLTGIQIKPRVPLMRPARENGLVIQFCDWKIHAVSLPAP